MVENWPDFIICLFCYFFSFYKGGKTANGAPGIYGDTCLTQKEKILKNKKKKKRLPLCTLPQKN